MPFAAIPYGDESRTKFLLDVALPVFAIGALCPSIESDSINSGTTHGRNPVSLVGNQRVERFLIFTLGTSPTKHFSLPNYIYPCLLLPFAEL